MKNRILVADNKPLIRKMLCKIFRDHKALEICDEALNGQEAAEKAERLRPDLIILDLAMPVLDGLRAAEAFANLCRMSRLFYLLCMLRRFRISTSRTQALDGCFPKLR
jgi:chemotaxis response regulator CheB